MAQPDPAQTAADDNHIIAERRAKLAEWRTGGDAFPNDFRRENLAAKLLDVYGDKTREELAATPIEVRIAGRIMLRRVMGKASFATIQDLSGRIQIFVANEHVGEEAYAAFKRWDIGDIVGVVGTLMRTRTGELSVQAAELRLLTKSLRPLPEKFHGLTDIEQKYRSRYLDLITNEQTRFTFIARSRMIQSLRNYMVAHGFLEVETPMMQPIPGGAAAKPFKTHHNALDMDLFLRIAPELYLKRLVVGGFEKVFEVNRNVRNEGLSPRHNPEFSMMEVYQAYGDVTDMMNLTEDLFVSLAKEIHPDLKVPFGDTVLDWTSPWRRVKYLDLFRDHAGIDYYDAAAVTEKARALGIDVAGKRPEAIANDIFEAVVEPNLVGPVFVTDYPIVICPLAKARRDDPRVAERFELFFCGMELANAFTELNDPLDQESRFLEMGRDYAADDAEKHPLDEDYLRAMRYGMPPNGGFGMGVDRLTMLLLDKHSIREVLLFPALRKEE
ncbi:MAG: lysine--tRNA ligase [Anaerolineales bacterium]|nr:lysine--tRNA ligase [Anaerolineales bacterium]